ncbi:hypothetical protein E2C01_076692 [Portunus trituberculatus]|uniref:Uncharacterized protein n=1 Tax=Portunus trituberculatus TaxID=210409 RepID=A0A5B7IMP4_PORTR|nr:hypothetical protein [Portunus trituberculatus]
MKCRVVFLLQSYILSTVRVMLGFLTQGNDFQADLPVRSSLSRVSVSVRDFQLRLGEARTSLGWWY